MREIEEIAGKANWTIAAGFGDEDPKVTRVRVGFTVERADTLAKCPLEDFFMLGVYTECDRSSLMEHLKTLIVTQSTLSSKPTFLSLSAISDKKSKMSVQNHVIKAKTQIEGRTLMS